LPHSEYAGIALPTIASRVAKPCVRMYSSRPSIMSSTTRNPRSITSVHTCTELDPRRMNSTASRQLEMPPMPLMGSRKRSSRASAATMCIAMGFTA
jgi:hypothetical protein